MYWSRYRASVKQNFSFLPLLLVERGITPFRSICCFSSQTAEDILPAIDHQDLTFSETFTRTRSTSFYSIWAVDGDVLHIIFNGRDFTVILLPP